MKRKLSFAIVAVLLLAFAGSIGAAESKRPQGEANPYIEYIKGSFGGPWYSDGWITVHPGQAFRIHWSAGGVRWCNKWSLDPQFKGPARARGEYWTRLYGPNLASPTRAWVYVLICGNGFKPYSKSGIGFKANAIVRLYVKVVT